MKKLSTWAVKGMNRDMSVSKFSPEFAFENMNLRLSTNEGNTTMSWVNEKGPLAITLSTAITGTTIGTAVLNDTLVLFTTTNTSAVHPAEKRDRIYKLYYNNAEKTAMTVTLLFTGNLNFYTGSPLETLVSYEAEHIQKVYWVDGRNQPRIINIANETKLAQWNTAAGSAVATFFDFVPTTKLQESVTIERIKTGGEMFPPGVIQYCFTYINKYGQQTNIAWVSSLYYLTHKDRGVSPEDEVVNAFKITITSPDSNFDYLRLYSIQRTSYNDTPVVKMLDDISTSGTIEYIDNGTTGHAMDPTELLYVGGREIIANTLAEKDNTMFIGNFSQRNASLSALQDYYLDHPDYRPTITFDNSIKKLSYGQLYGSSTSRSNDTYINSHTLTLGNKRDITTFKGGETYRFGFQLQKTTGEWTEAIFLDDEENDVYPSASFETISGKTYATASLVHAQATLNLSNINTVLNGTLRTDYKKIRPVVVYPTVGERTVLCQGVVNPTVFSAADRADNSPFAQSSWYFRPYMISTAEGSASTVDPVVASIISGSASYASTTTYDDAGHGLPPNSSLTPYSVVICNIPAERREEILKRGYLTYRHIIYAEFRFNDGSAPQVLTSSDPAGGYNYERTPWDKKLYFKGAVYVGNITQSGSTVFGGDAYMLLLPGSYIPPHHIVNETEGEYEGKAGKEFSLDIIEYWSDTGFLKAPGEDNTTRRYNIYSDLRIENGLLYYLNPTSNSAYNTYTFQVYYQYKTGNGTADIGLLITMNSSEGYMTIGDNKTGNGVAYVHYSSLPTQDGITGIKVDDINKRSDIEIQGSRSIFGSPFGSTITASNLVTNTQYFVDQSIITMHSPDIEFDTEVQNFDTEDLKMRIVGIVPITANASAHRITTSSAPLQTSYNAKESAGSKIFGVGETSNNIVHRNIDTHAGQRLVADYLWNDAYVVHDSSAEDKIATLNTAQDFLIFPWQRKGPLNNDPRNEDEASSWLKTKKESNLLYSLYSNYFGYSTITGSTNTFTSISAQIHLTENDYMLAMRLPRQKSTSSEVVYYPNVDKVLYNSSEGGYVAYYRNPEKLPALSDAQTVSKLSSPIEMKYKSTSHAVIALNGSSIPILPYGRYTTNSLDRSVGVFSNTTGRTDTIWGDTAMTFSQQQLDERSLFLGNVEHNFLWLAELYKNVDTRFGGQTEYAIKNNKWLPCGEAETIPSTSTMTLYWMDGDTYFQRYDHLKTYAFTEEDSNQLVEILSFMCETHVNIDGRYDRNRGQMDNTRIRPGIFNLLNPVYSQSDNFFTQRGVITDSEDTLYYPNQVTYTKTKTSGADVDLWTNVTLGSTLELDGDKGDLHKLLKFNDQILAFQDTGISQVLYNENVQIASTTGVPIEIANSGKVQGKRYLSDTVGCSNKWSIVSTPSGVYFIDSHDKSIYLFNGQLQNLSVAGGFNTWSKTNIPALTDDNKWTPVNNFSNFVSYHDRINQEVMFINKDTALSFSEKMQAFTSFYDYGNTPYFCNLDGTGVWVKGTGLWKHNAGNYGNFFGTDKPYWTTLISNPEPTTDKIFTNLEFRANVEGEGTSDTAPYLPFDSLETWNEYQHGNLSLATLTGQSGFKHFASGDSSLKRKFRMWRCDIPRDNAEIDAATEAALGIKRFVRRPLDRMRNPWLYLKLKKGAVENMPKVEIHDVIMTYFS